MEELMLIIGFFKYLMLMILYVSVVFIIPTYLLAVIATKCITFFLRKFKIYDTVTISMFAPKKDKCEHKNYYHYFQTGSKYYVCKDCEKWLGTEFYKVIHKREQEETKKTKQYIENLETIENE